MVTQSVTFRTPSGTPFFRPSWAPRPEKNESAPESLIRSLLSSAGANVPLVFAPGVPGGEVGEGVSSELRRGPHGKPGS